MSFTSKNLHAKRGGMGFIKGATLFFLGVSCVLFITKAFDITPTVNQSLGYWKTMIFSTNGNNLGTSNIVLDGLSGNAYFAGNVGIGTETPAYDLDVVGSANVTNDLSTDSNLYVYGPKAVFDGNVGIGINTPTYKLDVTGSGRFTNNVVVDGNVGIGISNPTEKLTVSGNILFPGNVARTIRVGQNLLGRGNDLLIAAGNSDDNVGGGNVKIIGGGDGIADPIGNVILSESGVNGGYVGIGTDTPSVKLDVNGDMNVSSDGNIAGSLFVDGNVGIGTTPGTNKFKVDGNSFFSGDVGIGMSPSSLRKLSVMGDSSIYGNVGIGILIPTERLHVAGGTAKVDQAVQVGYVDGRCATGSDAGKIVYANTCVNSGANKIYTPSFMGCLQSGTVAAYPSVIMTGNTYIVLGACSGSDPAPIEVSI
ncbi:MAG: hypothetical protein WC010_02785 [Candidatus Absconditabacterales bacterium]